MIKTLNRASTQEDLTQVIASIRSSLHCYEIVDYIDPLFTGEFVRRLEDQYPLDTQRRLSCRHWRLWEPEVFINHLILVFPPVQYLSIHTFLQRIQSVVLRFDLDNMPLLDAYFTQIEQVLSDFPSRTPEEETHAVKALYSNITSIKSVNWKAYFLRALSKTDIGTEVTKVDDWIYVWRQTLLSLNELRISLQNAGFEVRGTSKTRHNVSEKLTDKITPSHQVNK